MKYIAIWVSAMLAELGWTALQHHRFVSSLIHNSSWNLHYRNNDTTAIILLFPLCHSNVHFIP